MADSIRIVAVEQDEADGIIVRLSAGTAAGYVVEELLELRPHRLAAWAVSSTNPRLPES